MELLSLSLLFFGADGFNEAASTAAIAAMRINHKTEYWGKIRVGNPEQEFTVIFDTGSGNLIIPGENCKSQPCLDHRRYDSSGSTTSVAVGKAGKPLREDPDQKKGATVRFGTGEIHGQFYQDKLCFGGSGSGCTSINFIATTRESDSPFQMCNFDGILGLGFKDLSMGEGFNIMDDFVTSRSLPKNQFSVFLSDGGESEITFGGVKDEYMASDLFWVPVTRQSYWQIGIDDITFNNEKQNLCSQCQVAVDTGTSLLAGPTDIINQLDAQLGVKSDCSNLDSLPTLGFAVGDKVLNLLPRDYVDSADGTCSVALMTLDVPPPRGPLFIFGDPFLRRFVTVYDRDGPSVGFAVAKHNDDVKPGDILGTLRTKPTVSAEDIDPRPAEPVRATTEAPARLVDFGGARAWEQAEERLLEDDPKPALKQVQKSETADEIFKEWEKVETGWEPKRPVSGFIQSEAPLVSIELHRSSKTIHKAGTVNRGQVTAMMESMRKSYMPGLLGQSKVAVRRVSLLQDAEMPGLLGQSRARLRQR